MATPKAKVVPLTPEPVAPAPDPSPLLQAADELVLELDRTGGHYGRLDYLVTTLRARVREFKGLPDPADQPSASPLPGNDAEKLIVEQEKEKKEAEATATDAAADTPPPQ